MNQQPLSSTAPGFWSTVTILLKTARRRAVGRDKRQKELMHYRAREQKTFEGLQAIVFIMLVILMSTMHGIAVAILSQGVSAGQRIESEQGGKIVVTDRFYSALSEYKTASNEEQQNTAIKRLEQLYFNEGRERSNVVGGDKEENAKFLWDAVGKYERSKFASDKAVEQGIQGLGNTGSVSSMIGSLILLLWFITMTFQGEGLELDLQRRRHPMWEWLLTHPVPPGAVFLAEMLSPIAANPIYCAAPVFWGILFGLVYGIGPGILAGLLVGIPMAIATACAGKALEIAAMLRFPTRTRGAILGFMSWIGYAGMVALAFSIVAAEKITYWIGSFLQPLAAIHSWPYLKFLLGFYGNGNASFLLGTAVCLATAALITILAVWCAKSGAAKGIAGTYAGDIASAGAPPDKLLKLGREPLYRKELLWFWRDRGAVVQCILIPVTIAAVNVFNFRSAFTLAGSSWNVLAGAAILFGTYFLWILGPRSLASEGPALWLALTWPRGLESLLKAKAKLWAAIATGIVVAILACGLLMYPAEAWKFLLVALGWLAFARSMALKSVTLVSAPSSSGEAEKIPTGRRWAASLGAFTFAAGICTQQWHLAIVGIVYSWLTAAAMWQNFRARLPHLYDPWSEKLPQAPSLMHAMIAISALIEIGAISMVPIIAVFGVFGMGPAFAMAYGISAFIVTAFMNNFLKGRDVPDAEVWCWNTGMPPESRWRFWSGEGRRDGAFAVCLFLGAIAGLALGALGQLYMSLLAEIPSLTELLQQSQTLLAANPNLKISYAVVAVVLAPFAEEYLFRGILFRALDREWGGWRAVVGSAAFFAIYHSALAWIPVSLLGVACALLFKHTGRLAPAVLLHTAYNLVVTVF